MKALRISFFGSSLVSAYWNGAATYYRGIIKALHERGHQVTFYEPDAFGRQAHRDIEVPPWASVVVYKNTEYDAIRNVVRAAYSSDVLIKASGVGVFDELLERAVLRSRRPGLRVLFWDVDAPATLARVRDNPNDYFRHLIPQYDAVFTYGGGDPVVHAYQKFGARVCTPIYNALDPETHFRVQPLSNFTCDLAFLGNRLPDREARVDDFFFGAAHRGREWKFLLGGNGWQDKRMLDNVHYVGHVYTKDHNALNSSARAVLNIARDSMASVGFSPATRVFEAAGAGACIITDAWEGIESFLKPDEEVLIAEDGEHVASILRGLSEQRARRIGEAAQRRVLSEHTYAGRAEEVEQLLCSEDVSHEVMAS